MTECSPSSFAPALLRGLATLGPVEPFSGDLSLELGLSVWLRRSGTSVLEAREALIGLRLVVLHACGLDPDCEPTPLVGRAPRADVLTLAAYLADLLRRVAAAQRRGVPDVVAQVVAALPEPAAARSEALGA